MTGREGSRPGEVLVDDCCPLDHLTAEFSGGVSSYRASGRLQLFVYLPFHNIINGLY
jgi:hypothetical protein